MFIFFLKLCCGPEKLMKIFFFFCFFLLFSAMGNQQLVSAHFSCGITAGILASVITHPADVLKTKMQLYPHEFRNAYSGFIFIHTKYGLLGYFKGIVPRMLRRTLVTTMAWTVYEQVIY